MALREERLAQFVTDRAPDLDDLVEVLCQDHVGTYTLPFLCRRTDDVWLNGKTSMPLDVEVLGWRPAPIRRHR